MSFYSLLASTEDAIMLYPQVEMNWSVCKYLPVEASCQDYFNVVVGGHIHALYRHAMEERGGTIPGTTPIRRRVNPSQTQPELSNTMSSVAFAQKRIEVDVTQQMFTYANYILQDL